jgi:hypothetical protein
MLCVRLGSQPSVFEPAILGYRKGCSHRRMGTSNQSPPSKKSVFIEELQVKIVAHGGTEFAEELMEGKSILSNLNKINKIEKIDVIKFYFSYSA